MRQYVTATLCHMELLLSMCYDALLARANGLFEIVEDYPMSILKASSTFMPAEYAVYVSVAWYPYCGFKPDEKYVARIGAAHTLQECWKLIQNDKKAMGDTFGGLIEPVSTKSRTYSIWTNAGWTDVTALTGD